MPLARTVVGLEFSGPVMNAAGTAKTLEEVRQLANSDSSAIVVGTLTTHPTKGQKGKTFLSYGGSSLNSKGLPNEGFFDYYKENLPKMSQLAKTAGKPLIASVAGSTPSEFARLADLCFKTGASIVEINLGCPNLFKESEQKPILGFDLIAISQILKELTTLLSKKANITLKMSPFSDPYQLKTTAEAITQYPIVKGIVTTNTFPNCLLYTLEGGEVNDKLSTPYGLGALSGAALKPIGLGQVVQWRQNLPPNIEVIGVGGIHSGLDILEYETAGARLCQVGTAFLKTHTGIFKNLNQSYIAIDFTL